jgi:hypothetical protein
MQHALQRGLFIQQVNDQWIKMWAVLDGKDLRNRMLVQCIRAKSVDGFGGKSNKLSGLQRSGGGLNRTRVSSVKDLGHVKQE